MEYGRIGKMMFTVIDRGTFDKESNLRKMEAFKKNGGLTQEEYDYLVALMDEKLAVKQG